MGNVFKNFNHDIFFKPIIQIHGNGEIIAEGCGAVTVYTNEKVVFTSHGNIEIDGKNLVMKSLGQGYVSICGKITNIKFGEL